MIADRLRRLFNNAIPAQPQIMTLPELIESSGLSNSAGQVVTAERSKNIATAYRCGNILSDDVAKMPLQTFIKRTPGKIERMKPDPWLQNIAWLLEFSPNR
jgi:phage portal protein BeeE